MHATNYMLFFNMFLMSPSVPLLTVVLFLPLFLFVSRITKKLCVDYHKIRRIGILYYIISSICIASHTKMWIITHQMHKVWQPLSRWSYVSQLSLTQKSWGALGAKLLRGPMLFLVPIKGINQWISFYLHPLNDSQVTGLCSRDNSSAKPVNHWHLTHTINSIRAHRKVYCRCAHLAFRHIQFSAET